MITKSNFIVGHGCQRCFWFKYKGYEDLDLNDEQAQQRLKDGEEVGDQVKEIFPKGVEIPFLGRDYDEMHRLTLQAIDNGSKVIFEGSFLVDGVFIRVDIMNKSSDGWDIFEVKSSSKMKPIHKEDASIQWHVLNQVKDLELRDMYVITLDKDYQRGEKLKLKNVFKKHLLTEYVESNQAETSKTLLNLKKVAELKSPPKKRISGNPNVKNECAFKAHCWPKDIDNINSVFKLRGMWAKDKFKLYDEGIDVFEKIQDIKSFSKIHQTQIESTLKNITFINKEIIENFISKVSYPISYFDFETYSEPIPSHNGQKPNERVPFQYSLHIQKTPNDSVDTDGSHYEFLANCEEDPRQMIAESMLNNIPKNGSIITYHKSFEIGVIKDLARFCPDLSSKLLDLNNRILDLKDPFSKGGYYHPEFGGSFSIKQVLPALCKDNEKLDYKSLKISNGGMASNAFRELKNKNHNEIQEIQDDLRKYCWLDTYAMYAIYKKLLAIVNN